MQCLRKEASGTFSHDNFYHTVLGATDVRNNVYQAGLDILSGCRNGVTAPHAPQLATEVHARDVSGSASRS
jgi:glucan phosphoethanolaminetransferase (alkaline phosphatase superfamily)